MGIGSLIERMCKQTAVYWGNPEPTGTGGYTFDHPIEIECRWEDKKIVMMDDTGKEIIARSRVFVLQDLDEKGYLYLGEESDLTGLDDYPDNPRGIVGAFIIKQFHKAPSLNNPDDYIRTALLSELAG
jgi:hypothetical protein